MFYQISSSVVHFASLLLCYVMLCCCYAFLHQNCVFFTKIVCISPSKLCVFLHLSFKGPVSILPLLLLSSPDFCCDTRPQTDPRLNTLSFLCEDRLNKTTTEAKWLNSTLGENLFDGMFDTYYITDDDWQMTVCQIMTNVDVRGRRNRSMTRGRSGTIIKTFPSRLCGKSSSS